MKRRERQQAADLVHRVLDAVDAGVLSADGPAGAAIVRRLEGVKIALRSLDNVAAGDTDAGDD